MADLNLPEEPGKTASTIVGDNIVFVTVQYDQDASNPLDDMDGVGSIYSFDSRNRSHNSEAINEAMTNPDKVLLSYFEHGLCKWDVQSGSLKGTPDFEWDGTLNAGVWIPDHVIIEQANDDKLKGKKRADWMTLQAADACKLFTDFCNGEVYYYDIKAFHALLSPDLAANPELHEAVLDLPSDYRHSSPIYEDSCGGFYGFETFDAELKEATAAALSSLSSPGKEVAGPSA